MSRQRRRISVLRSASGDGLRPARSSFARTNRSIGLTHHSGVATAGTAVRTARDTRRAVAAATAGARATMNLLTALPIGGVVVAATVGVGPAQLYGSVPAQGCLLLGACLLLLGRWWVARLTRSATRPELAT